MNNFLITFLFLALTSASIYFGVSFTTGHNQLKAKCNSHNGTIIVTVYGEAFCIRNVAIVDLE